MTDEQEAAEVAVRIANRLVVEIQNDVMFNTPPNSFAVTDTCGRTVKILKDDRGNSMDIVRIGERGKFFKIVQRAYDIRHNTVVLELERL